MAHELDAAATERLKQYIDRLSTRLKDRRKRESFAIYAFGILGESVRKSVEPIAALACGDRTKTSRANSASITSKADPSPVGIITSRSSFAVMRSWWLSEPALFPPRPEGRIRTTRSASRPERHFADSFITFRLAIARALVAWLPRCPLCHRAPRRMRHANPSSPPWRASHRNCRQ